MAAPLFYALTSADRGAWDDGTMTLQGAQGAKTIHFPSWEAYSNNKKLWNLIMKHPHSFLKEAAHLAAFLVCLETGVAPGEIIRKFIARKWLHRPGGDSSEGALLHHYQVIGTLWKRRLLALGLIHPVFI